MILLAATALTFSASAQHMLVAQAKKDISGLTMTVDSYNKAFNRLKPALTNDETRNKAETWALAARKAWALANYPAGALLQKLSHGCDVFFDSKNFANSCSHYQTYQKRNGAADRNATIRYCQHTLHNTCDADDENCNSADRHHHIF